MRSVDAAFLAAVRASHGTVTRVKLVTPLQTGTTPTGVELKVVSGSVTFDTTADVRGTLDLELAEPWPTGTGVTSIAPYGSELYVERGIERGNGNRTFVGLGYFRITGVSQDDAPNGSLRVSGQTRESGVIEATLIKPRQFAAFGLTLTQIISSLVQDVYFSAPIAIPNWDDATGGTVLPRGVIVESDRWGFISDLARSYGKDVFFDYKGTLQIKSPASSTVPVWSVDAGKTGVLVSASRSISREGVCNAVVMTGEAMDGFAPVIGTAYDADPTSPTYWAGPFGKVPLPLSSPNVFSTSQANTAAAAELRRVLGVPYNVDLSAVPNPALEAGDCVSVVYPIDLTQQPNQRIETHVLDQLTIPLGASGAMTAKTRVQSLGVSNVITTTEPGV